MSVIIKNVGIKMSVNVKEFKMTKEDVMKSLFGILVIVNSNVINDVMLENIYIIKIERAEKK